MKLKLHLKWIILTALLLLGMLSAYGTVSADEGEITTPEACGPSATVTITGSKEEGYTLTISGEGKVTIRSAWSQSKKSKEYVYSSTIRKVIINEGITYISTQAFSGLNGLQEVVLPSTLTAISQSAFQNCFLLKKVDLKNVTSIDRFAFCGCTELTEVTGSKLKTIGSCAFQGTKLSSFTIPLTMTAFDASPFIGCKNLTAFYCADGHTVYSAADGIVYADGGSTLVAVPPSLTGTFTVPDSIEKIAFSAFSGNSYITKLIIPESVREIGLMAFSDMEALAEAEINCSANIGESSFQGCEALRKITIGDKVTGIQKYAFDGCTKLAFPELPDSVLVIGNDAFPFSEEQMATLLPERFGKIEGGGYAVMSCVTVSVSMQYDLANSLLTELNTKRTQAGFNLLMDPELCDIAMQRAAESSVYFDADAVNNPICPDASIITLRYPDKGLDEYIFYGNPDQTIREVVSMIMAKPRAKTAIEKADSKGIGIGCIETGGAYYWVLEISTKAGTQTAYQTGSVSRKIPVRYANYLLPKAGILIPVQPHCNVGECCEPMVLFSELIVDGSPGSYSCCLANESVTFSVTDTSVFAPDEDGVLYALKSGVTTLTASVGKLSYSIQANVHENSSADSDNAVLTHSCVVGDCYGIDFYVPETVAGAYDNAFLAVSRPEYTGNTVSGCKAEILKEYENVVLQGKACRKYSYYGLAAKEMSSIVSAELYGESAGKITIHAADEYSIAEYALEMLAMDSTAASLKTLLVDMLTYGAEAQQYFSCHTQELATAGLSAAMKQLGTQTAPAVSLDSYADEPHESDPFWIYGFSVSLDNRPSLNFYIQTEGEPKFEECEISVNGSSYVIPAEEWIDCGANGYRVTIPSIAVTACRTKYSLVCKKDGKAVSNLFTAGIEEYAGMAEATGAAKAAKLVSELLKFSDSAVSYASGIH